MVYPWKLLLAVFFVVIKGFAANIIGSSTPEVIPIGTLDLQKSYPTMIGATDRKQPLSLLEACKQLYMSSIIVEFKFGKKIE